MKNWMVILALALTTAACQTLTSSGVVPWGEEGKGLFSIDYSGTRTFAVERAQEFCAKQGKVKHIVAESGGEFVFKCVDPATADAVAGAK